MPKKKNIPLQDIIDLHNQGLYDRENLIVLCKNCHHKIHYTDNPELSPYRWESATTTENIE